MSPICQREKDRKKRFPSVSIKCTYLPTTVLLNTDIHWPIAGIDKELYPLFTVLMPVTASSL